MAAPLSLRVYLCALASLLLGYMFLGRGFAHIGIGPLYVGDAVFIGGIFILVWWNLWKALPRFSLAWIILLFMLWGAACTLPYLSAHGMNALRDAVVWGYGGFAFITAAIVFRLRLVDKILTGYGRLVPIAICALPVLFVIHWTAGDLLPRPPGSKLPLLYLKAGDTAVHLAGAITFLLLGLHQARRPAREVIFGVRQFLLTIPWVIGFAIAGITNRGGFLAVAAAGLVAVLLTPFKREWKRLLVVFSLLFIVALAFDLRLEGSRRTISARQMVVNVQTILGMETGGIERLQNNTATISWRLLWWREIMDSTLWGPYRWTGRGFGENLNDGRYGPLHIRSPHNSHLTILARAGVPGLFLWLLLQATFVWKLIAGYIVARRLGRDVWMRINAWILAFWAAFSVNTFFDVYLEGPQGGIWFWCLIGFGMAALQQQWIEYRAQVASAKGNPARVAEPPGQVLADA